MTRDGDDGARRRGPASRLPAHRAVLALGLLAAGPPLVLHDGWRGAAPAAAAAGYAVYLIAGKRWPLRWRRSRRRPTTPGSVTAPGPGTAPAPATAPGAISAPAGPAPTAEGRPGPGPRS